MLVGAMRNKEPKPPSKKTGTAPANAARIRKSQIKKKRFAEEYVASGGDGKTAARKAGSKAKDTTTAANELLHDPEVQAEIRAVAAEVRSVKILEGREILERLSEQATFDPTPYLNADGTVDLEKIKADNVGHLFQSWTVSETIFGKTCRAYPYSHQKALMQLAKCQGLEVAPKPNEFEAVRNGIKAYMDTNQCTLQQAIEFLSAKYPVVSRYAGKLMEEGVLPS
jgi:Terminase small subunit